MPQACFHGGVKSIPSTHYHKLVLAMKRDPLVWHMSCYRYRHGPKLQDTRGVFWWRKHYRQTMRNGNGEESACSEEVQAPAFATFVKFFNEELPRLHFLKLTGRHLSPAIGFMTYIYIWHFFRDPWKILSKTDAELTEYFQSQQYRKDMPRVHFLRTEQLNSDLHDFLLSRGFGRDALRFILAQGKANVSVATNPEAYFTPALADYVKEKNRIYYRYFWRDGNAEPPGSPDDRV